MLSIKNKLVIISLIVLLFSLSVVSATDNNSTGDDIQTGTGYVLNNQQNTSQHNYNISTNNKTINEKNITKNKDNNKLSLNYTINNDTGIVTFTDYREDLVPYEDIGYLYLEGIPLDSGNKLDVKPFQVNITNIMSDGTFKLQYMVLRNLDTISEEKSFTINNYESKTPITLKNNISLDDGIYNFTSTVINRKTGEIVRDNATIDYYGIVYYYDLIPTLVHWGTVNVRDGIASITHNRTYDPNGVYEFYPMLMNYTSDNFQGYYISREINKTYIEVPNYEELSGDEEIELKAKVYCYNKSIPINYGSVKFAIIHDDEIATVLGESQVKNNSASITCKIPEHYNPTPPGMRIFLKAYYSGAKEHNFEESSTDNLESRVGNKSTVFIETNPVEGIIGEIANFTVNVSSPNHVQTVPVAVKVNGITILRGKTINGTYTTNYTLNNKMFSRGSYKVTYVIGETWTTIRKEINTTLTIKGYDTLIQYNKTTVKAGDIVTIKVDLSNNGTHHNISGNLGFKLDGITYKNAEGPLVVKVVNGTATFTFVVTENMIGTHNITFTYSGNYRFEEKRINFTDAFIITEGKNRQHDAVIHYNFTTIKTNNNTAITVNVTDKSNQYYSTGGYVGMKINGITYIDSDGNVMIIKIQKGTAQFNINSNDYFVKKYRLNGYYDITFTFSGTTVLKQTKTTYTKGLYITP